MIYHGWLKPFEKLLLQSPLVPWAYFASNFYHNVYWYPFVGRKRVEEALKTKWGQLFKKYGDGKVVMPGMERKTVIQALDRHRPGCCGLDRHPGSNFLNPMDQSNTTNHHPAVDRRVGFWLPGFPGSDPGRGYAAGQRAGHRF